MAIYQDQTQNCDFLASEPTECQTHHDALEFPDGQFVLLTFLQEGQKATVLQLPASADAKAEQRVERVNSQLSLTGASALGV